MAKLDRQGPLPRVRWAAVPLLFPREPRVPGRVRLPCATLSRLGSRGPVLLVGEQGRDGGPRRQRPAPLHEEGAFEAADREE